MRKKEKEKNIVKVRDKKKKEKEKSLLGLFCAVLGTWFIGVLLVE